MQQFLRFKSLYQDRVWGGRVLETKLGRALPAGRPIGESWEIVDRAEAQSVINGGAFDGLTIRAAIEKDGAAIMGPRWDVARAFPILVKWLDCRERLSLQVHPPAAVAPELKGEPKTENWYIADCAPDSSLIVGLKRGVTREQFERAIHDNTLESCVHRFPVKAGDSILVHSGQIHAIDAGNLILEIQQNSDTTYRVYDWGRLGLDGKPRQMHVNESLKSIRWDDFEPSPVRGENKAAVIADAREFRIRRVPLAAGETLRVSAGEQARILSMVSGRVRGVSDGVEIVRGENVVLPFAGAFAFEAQEAALLLITENFS
ncbi:mannose-6-phosphate isomerase [Nibricoccus aquaticus]|uniref:Mannose-6-phosphate isomerase n=1 Tax=Nibricoccus aquaticus TaxID=2576891 RepID=A0A290QAN7_9BACT|nr:type I phosphomannose isomerase catalytic subunit [Nibricoccus aquaticus]ATC64260.1 mannose-6-phosphate isomerase [Nibricoccus aquaticus]